MFRNLDANTFCIGGGRNISVLGGDIGPSLSSNATGQQQPCVAKFPGQSTPAPANVLIEGVRFHDHNHADSTHTECLQVGGVSGLTIRRNAFRNCADDSLHIGRYDAAWPSRDVLIENNFFLSNSGASSERLSETSSTTEASRAWIIRYNSFAGQRRLLHLRHPDSRPPATPSARIYGNAAYRPAHSTTRQLRPLRDTRAIYSHNIWRPSATCSPTDLNADPLFISLTDLHLQAGSPAIDRGHSTDYPAVDIDGRARPIGLGPGRGRAGDGGAPRPAAATPAPAPPPAAADGLRRESVGRRRRRPVRALRSSGRVLPAWQLARRSMRPTPPLHAETSSMSKAAVMAHSR